MSLCENLSLGMFLRCSYFFTISEPEADVLINSVLRQNTACTFLSVCFIPCHGLLQYKVAWGQQSHVSVCVFVHSQTAFHVR